MDEKKIQTEQFEANRAHLQAVAYRMLGSLSEAEDAVQESWLRFSRADISTIDNVGGWLTTVVARICLDMLRTRKSRREDPLDGQEPEGSAGGRAVPDQEQELILADSVGVALLVVLQTLAPAERIAFVLHDMFGLPFEEIAPIIGREPAAARKLASRARQRIQSRQMQPEGDLKMQRQVVDAFLSASREGDLAGLLAVLDPNVVVRADEHAKRRGAAGELRGAMAVAEKMLKRQGARLALLNRAASAVAAIRGRVILALHFTIAEGRIVQIDVIANPQHLAELDVAAFNEA